jgi:hypothetical protein
MNKIKHTEIIGKAWWNREHRTNSIIIYDSRIDDTKGNKLKTPPAWLTVEVRQLSLNQILNKIFLATNSLKDKKAGVLTIICHGAPGYLEVGFENISRTNVNQFNMLKNRVEKVEVFACSVAGGSDKDSQGKEKKYYDWFMLRDLANAVNAPVRAAKEIIHYNWDKKNKEYYPILDSPLVTIYSNGVATETFQQKDIEDVYR